jgi:predicted metal-dependent phosphoesterase TrpH
MIFDLHCHSNCSDGELSVDRLLALAVEKKVDVLSITDHDTLSAYKQAAIAGSPAIKIIPGIELSTQWQKIGIHILGLNVQLHSGAMQEAVSVQRRARQERAENIARRLEKSGLEDALAGAKKYAGNAEISRPHFAQYMVETGFSRNIEQAFKKHLGAGKPGDIKQLWATMEQVILWIRDSGGVPVLAHPGKYSLTHSKLVSLLEDFEIAGGRGIEVLSGHQGKDITDMLQNLALQKNLLASVGSDFHSTSASWCRLGMHPALPKACTPVWSVF